MVLFLSLFKFCWWKWIINCYIVYLGCITLVVLWILRINLIYVITVVCKNLEEKYCIISHLWPSYWFCLCAFICFSNEAEFFLNFWRIPLSSEKFQPEKLRFSEKATKIWQNHGLFWTSISNVKKEVDFVKFWGLLKIYELYQHLFQ